MSDGLVNGVCSAGRRGVPKKNLGRGYLKEDFGLVGDAHAGGKERQISILPEQLLEPVMEKLGRKPEPSSFAENLLVSGLPESLLAKGTVLRVGEAVIEITEIGKDSSEPHTYSYEGFSLLADRGRFGRVIRSGNVKVGDPVEVLER